LWNKYLNMTDLLPFLKTLISAPGLSGFEAPVRDLISAAWKPLVDEISVSALGSLHGLKHGRAPQPRPRLMFAAHMDAVGLIVSGIIDGFVRIANNSGVDSRVLHGQLVTVHGRQEVPGLIVMPPASLLPPGSSSSSVKLEHMLIDTGLLPSAVAELVKIGDPVSFAQPPLELSADVLCGHTLDDRASVAALTICLDELQQRGHAWDVWAVASVQEETGYRGASTSAFQIRPDLAVALDVTFAKGPGSSDYDTFPLGKGLTLGWGPSIHPALYRKFKEIADQLEIPYAMEVLPHNTSTDGDAIQLTAEGVPTLVIGIPLRYMHTPVEMVSLKDIRRTGRLLAEFAARLDPDFMQTITWDN
jgi:tetrahedral aminopeptidase